MYGPLVRPEIRCRAVRGKYLCVYITMISIVYVYPLPFAGWMITLVNATEL